MDTPQTQSFLESMPRYLMAFDSRKLPIEECDVVVVGSGIAGCSTAIEAARGGRRVLLINKDTLSESNTRYAQGGIAAALGPESDAIESHVADTLAAGDGLCDEGVVREVVSGGPEAVEFLIASSCVFDREASGELDVAREAAHSSARVLHAGGDATGREIARGVVATALNEPHLRTYEKCFVIDILTHEERCVGLLVSYQQELRIVLAGAVVLASGGSGRMYRESSNPRVACGDGHAMALRAGAVLRDLEMVQFHPTLCYIAGAPRTLITEALRGAGAYLRNAEGERFMLGYDERAELAPRDVLSRAMARELERTRQEALFLDVSHLDQATLEHFPGFLALCQDYDIDISRSWVPVRPGPHYMIGGVKVDIDGASSLPGLYAVGEASSSGLHGANRLASNSLLEGAVLGRRLGKRLAETRPEIARDFEIVHPHDPSLEHRRGVDFYDLRNAFRTAMMRDLGVERDAGGLGYLLHRIEGWHRLLLGSTVRDPRAWSLVNMLQLGYAVAASAMFREESRGAHYRRDFPEHRDEYAGRHVECDRYAGVHW